MPIFHFRVWERKIMRDKAFYDVTADTRAEARAKLAAAQETVEEDDRTMMADRDWDMRFPDIEPAVRPMHCNDIDGVDSEIVAIDADGKTIPEDDEEPLHGSTGGAFADYAGVTNPLYPPMPTDVTADGATLTFRVTTAVTVERSSLQKNLDQPITDAQWQAVAAHLRSLPYTPQHAGTDQLTDDVNDTVEQYLRN